MKIQIVLISMLFVAAMALPVVVSSVTSRLRDRNFWSARLMLWIGSVSITILFVVVTLNGEVGTLRMMVQATGCAFAAVCNLFCFAYSEWNARKS